MNQGRDYSYTTKTPRTDAAEKQAEDVLRAYRAGPLTDGGLMSAIVAVTRILLSHARQLERELNE